jgi:hypothetical protein
MTAYALISLSVCVVTLWYRIRRLERAERQRVAFHRFDGMQ